MIRFGILYQTILSPYTQIIVLAFGFVDKDLCILHRSICGERTNRIYKLNNEYFRKPIGCNEIGFRLSKAELSTTVNIYHK